MSYYAPGVEGLLSPLSRWLNDPRVSELLINQPKSVWIEKAGECVEHSVPALTESHLYRLFQLIANENRQRLSAVTPLLSGSLPDGSRVQLCLPPTAQYPTVSIRRQVMPELNLDAYLQSDFYQQTTPSQAQEETLASLPAPEKALLTLYQTQQWDAFIKQAITLRKNMVISGGTSSGKTTFLNACLRQIPLQERIIMLEDTRELETPHPNQVKLLASKGSQAEAKVSMQDLVQCCLRLRPDRIIMGEIRGPEIMDFISSCSTGHEGGMTSIHANNPRMAFMRMMQLYKLNNVPSMSDADILRELNAVIDVVIQVVKTPQGRCAQSIYYRYGDIGVKETSHVAA